MLEQFSLESVLRRIEAHAKTGLLTIKQGVQTVEFYLHEGRLLCIGPMRTVATLGERLQQDGVISQQVFQEVRRVLGPEEVVETRVALFLMEQGLVSREELRSWSMRKAVDVLNIVLPWSVGELHFTENAPPPSDRLLVSMSVSALLDAATPASTMAQWPQQVSPVVSEPLPPVSQPLPPVSQPLSQPGVRMTPEVQVAQTVQSEQGIQSGQLEQTDRFATPPIRRQEVASPGANVATPQPPVKPSVPAFAKVPTFSSTDQFFDAAAFEDSPFAKSLPSTEGALPAFASDDVAASPIPPINGADLLSPTQLRNVTAGSSSPLQAINGSDLLASMPGTNMNFAVSQVPAQPMQPAMSIGQMASMASTPPPIMQPVAATPPTPPKRIDTSFMRPEMVLMPSDLSAQRDRSIPVYLSAEQWRVLTQVDGQKTLQTACQTLSMMPELLCQVVGELIAEGLIYLVMPGPQPQTYELSPVSRELAASGLNNGYVAPGYAAMTPPPWSGGVPAPDIQQQFAAQPRFETESQWGNGGNGATFIPGRGWIASPQPLQPLQPGGPLGSSSGIYAPVGGFGN